MRLEEMPTLEGEIERLKQQLAECQAREKVLRDALREALDYFELPGQIFNITWSEEVFAMQSDSTALDTLKKQWQREILSWAIANRYAPKELERMAKELE